MPTELLQKSTIFQDDKQNFMEILDSFNFKIKYLSYKLKYPEAETDLIIYLFELLKSLDLKKFETDQDLKMYINRCLKNKSIKLFNKIVKGNECISFTSETEMLDGIDYENRNDEYSDIMFADLISSLRPKQKETIFYKFYLQLSDIEIAKIFKISRQAVHKTQRLALENLKMQLSDGKAG